MTVRTAKIVDIPRLLELAEDMHAESSFLSMNFSADVLLQTIEEYMLSNDGLILVAENDEKKVIGMFMGCVCRSFFGYDLISSDTLLYVDKSHRGGFHGASMIKKFVQWSKDTGAKQIRPGVSTGDALASKVYERLGFKNVGLNFCLEV